MKNRLTLAQQLAVVKWLQTAGPFIEESMTDIARRCEKDLELPLTANNLSAVMKAAGIEVHKKVPEDEELRILTMAVYSLYLSKPDVVMPDGIKKLAKRYKLD